VMVNDGSSDESPQIAEAFAARDSRFRLVHQGNAGLGAARNTGVEHATGEFLVFADSDDLVPRHAYEVMLAALDSTGSDFACGMVRRLTSAGTVKAQFMARAFDRTRLQTHITRFPYLIADRTAWNKLFRRSFWDEHGFRFPRGVYYEDTPVTLPAHYPPARSTLSRRPSTCGARVKAGTSRSRRGGPRRSRSATGWRPATRSAASSTSGGSTSRRPSTTGA
jgi:CDP-glycerol glycerophosphotransferase